MADYIGCVVPAMERFKEEGLIGEWGITGTRHPDAIISALHHEARPSVVQVNTNLLDSPGNLAHFDGPARPRDILAAASENGVGVFGIRVLQAGALTQAFDRPLQADNANLADYNRAAPFRDLCATWQEDPADIALRYVLSMDLVDAIVLGVKNRKELTAALRAFHHGPLAHEQVSAIDKSFQTG